MKRFSKALFIAGSLCLIAVNSSTFAQSRFNKGGRPRVSSSRNQTSSMKSRSTSSANRSSLSRLRNSSSKTSNRSMPSQTKNTLNSLNGNTGRRVNNSNNAKSSTRSSNRISSTIKKTIGQSNTPSNTRNNRALPWTGGKLADRLQNRGSRTLLGRTGQQVSRRQYTTLPFNPGQNNGGVSGGNGSGNGNGNKGWQNVVRNIMKHNRTHWCHTRPTTCHWWTQYCKPIAHCHHHEIITCDWNRVHCNTIVHAGVPARDVQWYLGMKGMLLPGKGIGIEAIEPGSPAQLVGLQQGMVMTVCNGIQLVDEASMQEAIRISGGLLQMTLLSADGSQVLQGTVQMTQIAAVAF
jgi:hypothetical protein